MQRGARVIRICSMTRVLVFGEPCFEKGLALPRVVSDCGIGQGCDGSVPRACVGFIPQDRAFGVHSQQGNMSIFWFIFSLCLGSFKLFLW